MAGYDRKDFAVNIYSLLHQLIQILQTVFGLFALNQVFIYFF